MAEEKKTGAKIEQAPTWAWGIILILSFIFLISGSGLRIKTSQIQNKNKQVIPEKFNLLVGEEVPTVWVGPGTYHVLEANKSYKAVSVQQDGSVKIYEMSAKESWIGAEPAGRLRLIGKEPKTIVKIIQAH